MGASCTGAPFLLPREVRRGANFYERGNRAHLKRHRGDRERRRDENQDGAKPLVTWACDAVVTLRAWSL